MWYELLLICSRFVVAQIAMLSILIASLTLVEFSKGLRGLWTERNKYYRF